MARLNKDDLAQMNEDYFESLDQKRLVQVAKFFPGCDFCVGRPYDPSGKIGYDGKGMIKPAIQAPSTIDYKFYK